MYRNTLQELIVYNTKERNMSFIWLDIATII